MTQAAGEIALYTPHPSPHSEEFWSNLKSGTITIQRCQKCQRWTHPPLEVCRWCGGPVGYTPVSGTGTVYSYTTMHSGSGEVFPLPYTVAVVELAEQEHLRMIAQLILDPGTEPWVGMKVAGEIVTLPGTDVAVVAFKPVD